MRTTLSALTGVVLSLSLAQAQTCNRSPLLLDATNPSIGALFQSTASYPAGAGLSYYLALDFTSAQIPIPGIGELCLAGSGAFVLLDARPLDMNGRATFSFLMPSEPLLVGGVFFLQSLVVDPMRPSGAALSNLFTGVISTADDYRQPPASLQIARAVHSATPLLDGTILLAGGGNGSLSNPRGTDVTEVFFPWSKASEFTRDVGGMQTRLNVSRALHTATLLTDGTVLICGGVDPAAAVLASAEVHDPATGLFTLVGSMASGRAGHTAARLPDGRVLVMGGTLNNFVDPIAAFSGSTNTTQIYNPVTRSFSNGPNMTINRMVHASTTLVVGPTTYVLVTGGISGQFLGLPTYARPTEAWSSATGTFARSIGPALGNATADRVGHSLTLLANGRVLAAGGANGLLVNAVASAEQLDPATGAWSATGSMPEAKVGHSAVLLPGGRVLMSGGANGSLLMPVSSAQSALFTGAGFVAGRAMPQERALHTATLRPDGSVVILGGATTAGALSSTLVYQP